MLQKSQPGFWMALQGSFFEKIVFDQELAREDRRSARPLRR
jgi:hypothetical protein